MQEYGWMEGAETERRMHIVWFYVHEKQNMQRDSITSKSWQWVNKEDTEWWEITKNRLLESENF